MHKLAFSSNAFRKYTLFETIKILSELGYEGVEIMADIPHAYPPDLTPGSIEEIKATLDKEALEISNINAFMLNAISDFWHPSWIERDPALRKKRVDHTLDCIDLAYKLGAKTISTEPGGPLDGMDPEEGRELFLKGLAAIEGSAREKGIRVLIEPEPELLIETSNQFKTVFGKLDPTVFGLNFDIGHFFCVGENPVTLVKEHKDVTYHFHLEDIATSRVHHHLIPGAGVIDLKGVLEAIQEIEYEGFITVELYPYEDNPVATAKTALEYLKGIGF